MKFSLMTEDGRLQPGCIQREATEMWLRSGWGAPDLSTAVALAEQIVIETKFNPNHDPQTARFTSGPGGSAVGGASGTAFVPDQGGAESAKPGADLLTPVSATGLQAVTSLLNPVESAEAAPLPSPGYVSLAAHEAAGGHAIRKHVGKNDAQLMRMANTELPVGPFFGLLPVAESSFPSLVAADKLVSATLAANRETVQAVASGQLEGNVPVDLFPDTPTGREAFRPGEHAQAYLRTTNAVRVVIRQDSSMPGGYLIVTAFPFFRQRLSAKKV